ncbi:unnamed protein product [Microthlaspi erraticum]|uniref:Uncharacterized protein n=1 Tax=Microthlaspi erraticum TaxID=1685480 RepID=A0A6D2L333_9BRAS|nr:unnamed protein product [Microthlaspi erraticum]
MSYCSQLTTFPDFSRNIKIIKASKTKIEDVPASVAGGWSRLDTLEIGSTSLTKLTKLDLSSCDIKNIPDCVIGLPGLEILNVQDCSKLVSLQSLPPSLLYLYANNCGSLKSVSFSFDRILLSTTAPVLKTRKEYHHPSLSTILKGESF